MAGFLLGFVSGGQNLLSGNWFAASGAGSFHPQGGFQLLAYPNNSGYIYVSISGNLTITSGGITSNATNSSGYNDGTPLAPGFAMFMPKLAFPYNLSGNYTLYFNPDSASSGQARIDISCW